MNCQIHFLLVRSKAAIARCLGALVIFAISTAICVSLANAQSPPYAKADVGISSAQWFSFGGEDSLIGEDPPQASLATTDGNAIASAQAYIDDVRFPELGVLARAGRGASATVADNFFANLSPDITTSPDGVIFNMRLSGTMRAPVNGTGPFGWFEDSNDDLMAPLVLLRLSGQTQTEVAIGEVALTGGPVRKLEATSSVSLGTQNIFTDANLGVQPLPGVVISGNDATASFNNYRVPFLFEDFPVNTVLGDHTVTFSLGIGTGTTSLVGPVPTGTLGDFSGTLAFDPDTPVSVLLGDEIVDLPPGSSFQLGENAPLVEVGNGMPPGPGPGPAIPEPSSFALAIFALLSLGMFGRRRKRR